jgi:hypothetical protein
MVLRFVNLTLFPSSLTEIGELRQEIFVNAPKDIPVCFLKRRIVEDAQEVA